MLHKPFSLYEHWLDFFLDRPHITSVCKIILITSVLYIRKLNSKVFTWFSQGDAVVRRESWDSNSSVLHSKACVPRARSYPPALLTLRQLNMLPRHRDEYTHKEWAEGNLQWQVISTCSSINTLWVRDPNHLWDCQPDCHPSPTYALGLEETVRASGQATESSRPVSLSQKGYRPGW